MTLSTDVLVTRAAMPDAVWDFVKRELLHRPDYVSSDEVKDGRTERWGTPGQGALAWAIMKWFPDGPVPAVEFTYDDDTEEVGEEVIAHGSVLLDFDTAYGFHQGGAGCGDLHAYFILRLFGEFGTLWWRNEFTGEWHLIDDKDSSEQLEALLELGDPVKGCAAVKAELVTG